ncbi:hypothetical protein [Glycomyces dulcitolivorans]|uniref:hypothetical protein n=1 Tax=Glycomyces dulcitolivorans TaxID=2200759 RepID=UPI001300B837|nr:hypothetical protein [Glycomyces dulcitolivorans]
MRLRFPLIAAAAAALLLIIAAPAPAGEAGHAADITLSERKGTCEVRDVPVGAAPPAEVRIDSDDVDFDCSGSIDFRLGRDTSIAFDDAEGTATADVIRIVGAKLGFTCGYEATDVVFQREGQSRETLPRKYVGGPYTGKKVQGSFLCPGSVQLDRAAFSFR